MEEKRVEWVRDREFHQDGIVVTVWKLPLRRPRFRYEIGCKVEDKVFRQFSVFIEGQGRLQLTHSFDAKTTAKLVDDAVEYIRAEAQTYEDERIDRMQTYESRGQERDRPAEHKGLKKLAARDKILRTLRQTPPNKD